MPYSYYSVFEKENAIVILKGKYTVYMKKKRETSKKKVQQYVIAVNTFTFATCKI